MTSTAISSEAYIKLIDVLAHIAISPARYDQDYFVNDTDCGTSFCIAGWAVQRLSDTQITVANETTILRDVAIKLGLGGRNGWRSVGAKALDITRRQAYLLFSASNTLPQIIGLIAAWFNLTPGEVLNDAAQRADSFWHQSNPDGCQWEEVYNYLKTGVASPKLFEATKVPVPA